MVPLPGQQKNYNQKYVANVIEYTGKLGKVIKSYQPHLHITFIKMVQELP